MLCTTKSNTNWNILQIQQNIALRTITGCVQMTNIDDLHRETKFLPVKTHTDMLAKQFLAGCHQSLRSDYQTTQHPVERLIKPTLRATYGVENQKHLNEGLINRKNYRKALKVNHYNETKNHWNVYRLKYLTVHLNYRG